MILCEPVFLPIGSALWQRLCQTMDIILHIGAHRTGSTTYQAYMRDNLDTLDAAKISFWGPRRTRKGLFRGLMSDTVATHPMKDPRTRAEGRVKLRLEQARAKGMDAVLVSEENMIGSVRASLRAKALYPNIADRVARFARAFDGNITRVAFCIRSQDRFWASALAYGVFRGHPIPGPKTLAKIAKADRSWRHVISDLACVLPETEIRVLPYESFYANPITLTHQAVGLDLPLRGGYEWLNRAPSLPELRRELQDNGRDVSKLPDEEGPWRPFSQAQIDEMQEKFADDLFWLAQGAGGAAVLTEEAMPRERGQARHAGQSRGHENGKKGRLDKAG